MHKIFASFLSRQLTAGRRLAARSDVLELTPLGPEPVQRYLARFACSTLVRGDGDEVRVARGFTVGLFFPSDYLVRASPFEVATWLAPANVFLPQVRPPFICLGRITPGMALTDLLQQVFDVGIGAKLTVREDDALDAAACAWARHNLERFPIDPHRSLLRAQLDFELEERG